MSARVLLQQQQQAAMRAPGAEKPYSLFMVSPERVLGLKRAAEPFLTHEQGGEQRLAKTPKTKPLPHDGDDGDEGMRYPLRSRTPLSQMKNLGFSIPPPPRAAATATATAAMQKAAVSIPVPRPRATANTENDAPTPLAALPKPVTAAAASVSGGQAAHPVPLAAICRTAVTSWKRKEGAEDSSEAGTIPSNPSSSRRGSRSRGGRGRSTSVRVVVVPVSSNR